MISITIQQQCQSNKLCCDSVHFKRGKFGLQTDKPHFKTEDTLLGFLENIPFSLYDQRAVRYV